jgi:hypothetical protein
MWLQICIVFGIEISTSTHLWIQFLGKLKSILWYLHSFTDFHYLIIQMHSYQNEL